MDAGDAELINLRRDVNLVRMEVEHEYAKRGRPSPFRRRRQLRPIAVGARQAYADLRAVIDSVPLALTERGRGELAALDAKIKAAEEATR